MSISIFGKPFEKEIPLFQNFMIVNNGGVIKHIHLISARER